VFSGRPFKKDLIVASDIGTNVSRYSSNGKLLWRATTYPNTVRAIDISENSVIAYAGDEMLKIDLDTGKILNTKKTGQLFLFNKKIGSYTLRGLDDSGRGVIYINDKKLPYKTKWARDAIINHKKLYVADTFGYRVAVFDLKSLKFLYKKDFYYPNDLVLIKNRVKVVEEHGNRIIDVDSGNIEFSCPLWAYMQNKISIEKIEPEVVKLNSAEGIGRCAREYMGENTLYSPNGAVYFEDELIIADTDNHRIIAIQEGKVVSEILNINNPVRIILTKATAP